MKKNRITYSLEDSLNQLQDDFYDESEGIDSDDHEFDANSIITEIKYRNKPKKRWEVIGEGTYKPTGDAVTIETIPAGYYSLHSAPNIGSFIIQKTYINDERIKLPNKIFDEIIEDVTNFWTLKDKFEEYGFIHKRGILLHGKQGNGKTFLMGNLIENVIDNLKGIVFSISNAHELHIFSDFFSNGFRVIEPDRPVIVTLEDIDGLIKYEPANETLLLNILDGIKHTSNIVYIGTTNHIEALEERIINRPSRFDRIYRIEEPNAESRRIFITSKIKPDDLKNYDIDMLVEKTEGYSTSHIKELIISIVLYKNTVEDAIERLDNMRNKPVAETEWSKNSKKRAGFT